MFRLQKRYRRCRSLPFNCMFFRENFTILWSNLKTTLFNVNPLESNFMFSFLQNLDRKHNTMFILGGLPLPFDSKTTTILKRWASTAVGKIYKICSDKLCDLEAPWLKVKYFLLFSFLISRKLLYCISF